jgi:hypothetical protein
VQCVPVTWDLLPFTHYTFILINLIMWTSLIISNQKDPGKEAVVDPDPHHFGNLDPHPHQIKSRIRIKIYKLVPEPDSDPHQFTDVKPKCMEYEPI